MLVILLTRPREGRILSVLANLEPNHLAQFQLHGPLKEVLRSTSNSVVSQEPVIPLGTHAKKRAALAIIPTATLVSQSTPRMWRQAYKPSRLQISEDPLSLQILAKTGQGLLG